MEMRTIDVKAGIKANSVNSRTKSILVVADMQLVKYVFCKLHDRPASISQ